MEQYLWKGKDEKGRKREEEWTEGKLSCHGVSMEALGETAESFEAGSAIKSCPKRGKGTGPLDSHVD